MSSFFERLREERERLGLIQSQLAELGGVKKQSQINYESGKRKPDAEYLASIARHGIDTTYVLTGIRVPEVVKAIKKEIAPLVNSEAYQTVSMIRDNFGDVLEEAEQTVSRIDTSPPLALAPALEVEIDGSRFATVARHEASASAGGGSINFEGAPIDHLAFSKTWLSQNGIQASASILINARGQSMEPSIYDGDLIMIDRRKRKIRNGRIYVYNDPTDGTRVKRLEVVPGHTIIVRSDNPDQKEFPPEYHTGDAMAAIVDGVVGEVVWSGHKWT